MSQSISIAYVVALTMFGLLFGSFANVVIWRFPRGESIVSPSSRCPHCETPVRWYDNVPVLSWIVLRARCRSCRGPIAARYPLVEALSGLLWLSAALAFGLSVQAVLAALFFWMLLVLTFIDLDTMRLPNPLVAAIAVGGLLGAVVSQVLGISLVPLVGVTASGIFAQPAFTAVIGCVLGAGLSGGVAALYAGVRGKSGFGMGDVKLLGAMGLFLGPYVLLALMIGSLVGAVAGIIAAARSGAGLQSKIPFGPFLALGGVVTVLFGPALMRGYLSLVGIG